MEFSSIEAFEVRAKAFRIMTGHIAPGKDAAAMREIDRCAAASEAELSTLRQHLAEAVRERDALRSVVQSALNNNGGPIDADSTLDGKSYVMVLREDFDAIDAASRVAGT